MWKQFLDYTKQLISLTRKTQEHERYQKARRREMKIMLRRGDLLHISPQLGQFGDLTSGYWMVLDCTEETFVLQAASRNTAEDISPYSVPPKRLSRKEIEHLLAWGDARVVASTEKLIENRPRSE